MKLYNYDTPKYIIDSQRKSLLVCLSYIYIDRLITVKCRLVLLLLFHIVSFVYEIQMYMYDKTKHLTFLNLNQETTYNIISSKCLIDLSQERKSDFTVN